MNKQSLSIFPETIEALKAVGGDNPAVQLLSAMAAYEFDGEEPTFDDPLMMGMWTMLKSQMDRKAEFSKKQRENAGGRNKTAANGSQVEPNAAKCSQPKPTEANRSQVEPNAASISKSLSKSLSVSKSLSKKDDDDENGNARGDGVSDFFPQPFMTDDDATTIQQDHDAILDAAENAGFPQNQATFDLLIRLYAEHGTDAVLFGIEQCVKQGKSKPSYLEAVIRNRGKPKPTGATDAIYFPEGGESFG